MKFDFGDGPVDAHRHSNGSGLVANTATVAASVYVGPNARVYGNARVEGFAIVEEYAEVYGSAVVSGNARIYGAAKVCGNATVGGPTHVFGNAWIYGAVQLWAGKHAGTNPTVKGLEQPDYFRAILSTIPAWEKLDHLSPGQRQELFRELAERIKKYCPEAADYLSSW